MGDATEDMDNTVDLVDGGAMAEYGGECMFGGRGRRWRFGGRPTASPNKISIPVHTTSLKKIMNPEKIAINPHLKLRTGSVQARHPIWIIKPGALAISDNGEEAAGWRWQLRREQRPLVVRLGSRRWRLAGGCCSPAAVTGIGLTG
ncbi:glutamate decarboxylase alpha [Striga asiatica]|uniref:Glutamate decarboxylase alpha n=1 Tax=Striga asiatica TaxID=4170 RepID=A0A5A7NXR4_STRAF|nr:glutamate decarboxylase alpha [Striga asiatica]